MSVTSIFPVANMLESWTKYIDREIISKYLSHTGSLACVCKASERECLTMSAGRLCCPTRQFHHPEDAKLAEEIDDEEGLIEVAPRFRLSRGSEDSDSNDSNEKIYSDGSSYNDRAF